MKFEDAHDQGRLEARLMMDIQRAQNTVQQMIDLTGGEPDWLECRKYLTQAGNVMKKYLMEDKLDAVRFALDHLRRKAGTILERRINAEGMIWENPSEFVKELLAEAWETTYGQNEEEEKNS